MSWKPVAKADLDLSEFPVDLLQKSLLLRLDGTSDVMTLAQTMGLPTELMETLLAGLVTMGAVTAEKHESTSSESRNIPADEAFPPKLEPETLEMDDQETTADDKGAKAVDTSTHRKLYEQTLHHRPLDERVTLAHLAAEPELSAYCFDPMPKVILAILENPNTGLVQARLIAAHHRNPTGLEAIASRVPYANDAGVRLGLLQNPQLPGTVFRRLWSSRRLSEQYLVTISRDAPEQTRRLARDVLRTSFLQRTGEERVELILSTEGRCLIQLAGLTIDGKTTALLCRRTYASNILVQNIARWSAAPPQLIAHLRRQDIVRRNPQLRLLLERHPNAS